MDSTIAALSDTVDTVATPVNDTVATLLTPVGETADQLVTPAAQAIQQATAVTDAVDNAVKPVAVTIAGGTTGDRPTPSSGRADTAAAGGGDGHRTATAGGGGDPPVMGDVPGSADDPLGSALDALASGPQPGPGVPDGPLASLPFGDASSTATPDAPFASLPVGDPSSIAPPFAAPPGGAAASAAQGASDSTVIDAIAATATDPQVLAVTAVAFTIGVTLHGSRILCSGEGQLMFTNVRLLPCMIRESVQHHIAPLVSALPSSGAAAPAAALSPPQGAVKGGSGSNAGVPDGHRGLSGLAQSFRDGFEDAVGGGNREIGDDLGDSRLMIQIGMALGFLYAAFLSVWFWATRLRERPDREQEA